MIKKVQGGNPIHPSGPDHTKIRPSLDRVISLFQVVLIQICMAMEIAMTKTIIEPVSLMVGTAVVPVSTQVTAQNANVTAMLPQI